MYTADADVHSYTDIQITGQRDANEDQRQINFNFGLDVNLCLIRIAVIFLVLSRTGVHPKLHL